MNEKNLQIIATMISGIFNPFLIPFIGFLLLFLFSFLSFMPLQYKIAVLSVVYCFTILQPMLCIFIYQKINKYRTNSKNRRIIPYILTIIAYAFCFLTMHHLGLPHYMSGIILATLLASIICTVLNLKWEISKHMIGAGGFIGGLIAFGFLFNFNPIWGLCLGILATGVLGTSRIILKQHTLGEVTGGFLIGFICAVYGILYSYLLY